MSKTMVVHVRYKSFYKNVQRNARVVIDQNEFIHYISIKHAPCVSRVYCWDIMHAAYVIGTSARNSRYILQKK